MNFLYVHNLGINCIMFSNISWGLNVVMVSVSFRLEVWEIIQCLGIINGFDIKQQVFFEHLVTNSLCMAIVLCSFISFQPLVICFWKYSWKECFNSLVGVPNACFWQKNATMQVKPVPLFCVGTFHTIKRLSILSSALIQMQITYISFDYLWDLWTVSAWPWTNQN